MRVVEQIACQVRKLLDNLRGDIRVSWRGDEDTQAGRGEHCHHEVPSCRHIPWPSHHSGVGGHAQELVQDRPSGIPGIGTPPLVLKPIAACGMKRRVFVGSVYEHIGVDDQHYRPSMAW
jgi:hypothetical protein